MDENRKLRLKKYDYDSYLSRLRHPLLQQQQDEYAELTEREMAELEAIPRRIQQLRQIIDWEKAQLNDFEGAGPMYSFDLERGAYREVGPNGLGEQLPVLDEARMYPQEDEFRFEEAGPYEDDFQESSDRYGESSERRQSSHHHMEQDAVLTEEETVPSGRLREAKLVEDPTEFAYAPPNPLFYKKVDAPTTEDKAADVNKIKTVAASEIPPQLKVIQRSGLKLPEENDVSQFRSNQGDFETWMENHEVVAVKPEISEVDSAGVYIIAVVAGISAAATVGLIAVGIGWYNLQKHAKNGCDGDYPAYGVTGPNKDLSPTGERRLAQSAQMYHYQHQKQQIISMESCTISRVQPGDRNGSISEAESDEENEEGDYTVYECPGLAPTGEMEVKNPLFQDDPTPAQTPASKPNEGEEKK
ncbi:unnamed protein product [Acanthoscelides obtectus]|uniref:Neural proliferation differentiation and control protein 1 n=1 Tax=Acanthoscelides obtectus TaxID=200917 RepID=A0A9P0LTK9_ACAOB|nr:unnamed protein product [Acanthoscelides obtectus]CAK1645918.1 Neural proliferation differentiation and control protein 1 [Acanthoscelides obtectus]